LRDVDSWSRSSGTRLALRACVVVVAALATLSTGTTVAVVQRAAAASCSTCGQNLILNPSAEAGPGTSSDSVVKVPDWKQTGGFTAAEYSWSGGDISATSPGPSARGKNYFYGGSQEIVPFLTKSVSEAGAVVTTKPDDREATLVTSRTAMPARNITLPAFNLASGPVRAEKV
jgi:hypothetical protein